MSSVNSPADRSKNGDEVRRTRDAYQQKETEANKKQAAQLKKLTEAHYSEVQKLKSEHAAKFEELKNSTKELLSRRDMEYQKDITELRDLYQKQIQRIAYDSEEKQQVADASHKADTQKLKEVNDQRTKVLRANLENQVHAKDQEVEQTAKRMREQYQEEDNKRVGQMNRKMDKNVSLLVKDRDERLAEKQDQYDRLRSEKNLEIKRLKGNSEVARDVILKSHEQNHIAEREENRLSNELQRENMAQGLKEVRDRYADATDQMRRNTEEARDALAENVNKRIGDRMNALESDNSHLRAERIRDKMRADGQKDIELSNLKSSLSANIENLEKARLDTIEAAAKKTEQEIARLNKKNDESLSRERSFFRDKMSMDGMRSEERVTRLSSDHTREKEHDRVMNDSRFAKLKSFGEIEQEKNRAYFERAATIMKTNFEDTLREVRDKNKRDQESLFKQFSKQAMENDTKFQEKINEMSVRYERQFVLAQDQHQKDLKELQKNSDREKAELNKRAVTDLESQAARFEYRIGKMEEAHKREIEALHRKHEETLANLTKVRQS